MCKQNNHKYAHKTLLSFSGKEREIPCLKDNLATILSQLQYNNCLIIFDNQLNFQFPVDKWSEFL